MPNRNAKLALALLLTFAAGVMSAQAQTAPGVGYDPAARGFRVSQYRLDSLNSPFHAWPMDFSADPGAVGASPNPYYLNFSDPAVVRAFEARYGPNTTGPRFKSWIGPGNEVRFVVADALRWWFQAHPQDLGAWTPGLNGEPTEREITDVQATGDSAIWHDYLVANIPGFSPDNRDVVIDPLLPTGDGQGKNDFWNMPYYFHNRYAGYYPFSPPVVKLIP